MKKSTFLIITSLALLGCAYFEATPDMNSQAITEAQERNVIEAYDHSGGDSTYEPYHVVLDDEIIVIVDAMNGKAIHSERWDSGSELAKAILKDNE